MTFNDLKIYMVNSIAMALSFTNIENFLKIILLIASIFYTIMKTIELIKEKNNGNKRDNS